jgi:hypothetical protein
MIMVAIMGLANTTVSLANTPSGANVGSADIMSLASITTAAAKIKIGTLRQEGILYFSDE